jgi:hypothetical protein
MALMHGFNPVRQSTPIGKQQASQKPSTQASPAPDQASKPSMQQAKQTQHPGKASQKTTGKACP